MFAVAPTAKAARTVERDTGIPADTVAKLLHEWQRTDRPPSPEFQLPAGATLIVDEAGMLTTPALHQLVSLADRNGWRLALVGDPRQLQGVGRSGLVAELCANGRVETLERLHRFTHRWEAAASLQLRCGDPRALDAYEAHDRIVPGTLEQHLDRIAATWIDHHQDGRTIALVASTNDQVDTINHAVQATRLAAGHLDPELATRIAPGETAHLGDVIATRRNDRRLTTTTGQPVRNRDTWTVTAINHDGSITVSHRAGHGDVTLPADYVREHVRLGYAATEHGWQSDTVDTAIALTSPATTRRGLYVAATRGLRTQRHLCRSPTATTSPKPATSSKPSSPPIAPTSPPRRNAGPSPSPRRDTPPQHHRRHAARSPTGSQLSLPTHNVACSMRRLARRSGRRGEPTEPPPRPTPTPSSPRWQQQPPPTETPCTTPRAERLEHAGVTPPHNIDSIPPLAGNAARCRANVHIAEQQLDRAEDYLERTRQRTVPAIERHAQATTDRRNAHEQLRNCDTIDLLDAMLPSAGEHRRRVQALTAWQHWAQGHDLPDNAVHSAFAVLAHQLGVERHLAAALRNDLHGTPIDRELRAAGHVDLPGVHVAQHDFGIEL